jgi:DNA anti-recombination protein RmuC
VQNSEVASDDSSNAKLINITASQLQDLIATLMTSIQTESCKQTAVFQAEVAKQTETLKAQFKQENEKLSARLSERFEAASTKLREECNSKLQYEIQSVSGRVGTLKRDHEHDIQ